MSRIPRDQKLPMSFTIEPDVRRALKRESAETDRPMADIVNEALRKALKPREAEKQTA